MGRVQRREKAQEKLHEDFMDLRRDLRWSLDQLLYYLKNPMDTEASKVWERVAELKERWK